MAALVAGALLAYGLSAGLTAPDLNPAAQEQGLEGVPGAGADPTGTVEDGGNSDAAGSSGGAAGGQEPPMIQPKVGECLLLDAGTGGAAGAGQEAVVVVPCAEGHHLEVVGLVDPAPIMSDEPSQQEWSALLNARCAALLEVHLGKLWDPRGQFRVRMAAPSPAEWRQGDHLGECLVSWRAAPDGPAALPLSRGPLSQLDQSPRYLPGTCLAQAMVVGAPPTPVGCTAPHHLEVVASLDLSTRFAHAPDDAQWASLDQECAALIPARLPSAPARPAESRFAGSAVRIPVLSWLAGSRHSGCVVGELDAATGLLLERTASLGG